MSSALPIVSARDSGAVGEEEDGNWRRMLPSCQAAPRLRSPAIHLRRSAHPFVEPALWIDVSPSVDLHSSTSASGYTSRSTWYYPQPVGSSGETGSHRRCRQRSVIALAHQSSSSSAGQLLITRLGSSPRSSARWQP